MTHEPAFVVVCPACRTVAPAPSARCRRCLRDLRGEPERTTAAARALIEQASARETGAAGSVRARMRRRSTRAAAVVVVLVVLLSSLGVRCLSAPGALPLPAARTAAMPAGADAWPAIGGNLGATRALPADPALDAPLAWTQRFGPAIALPLVADAGALYVVLGDGRLLAVSADQGEVRWSLDLGDVPVSAPVIAGDRLFVALPRGRLLAVDRISGRKAWDTTIPAAIATSPLVADGVVYAFGAPYITGLDAASGATLWRVGVGDSVALAHAAIEGDWMTAVTTDQLLVFDRRTGERTYWYQLPPVIEGLAIADGIAFVAASRTLVAVAAASRRPWWEPARAIWFQFWVWGSAPRTPPPPSLWVTRRDRGGYPPAVSDDGVVTAAADGSVASYDRRTGALRWQRTLDRLIDAPIATAGGVLVAQADALRLLDAADGSDVALRRLEGTELTGVLATGHGLYLTTRAGAVLALR